MDDLDLRLAVWRKATSGWRLVSNLHPEIIDRVNVAPRLNTPGVWSLSMPWDKQPSGGISKAHLVTFDFRGDRPMTGRINQFGASTDETGQPVLDLSGLDVSSILSGVLGFPNPGRGVDDQDSVRWFREGPAEDVLSAFIRVNLVDRLGYDMVVAQSQGRGPQVTVSSEFANVGEVVSELATFAGLRLRVGLVQTTTPTRAELRVWFEQPVDRSVRSPGNPKVTLSSLDGNLRAYRDVSNAPTATRAIIQAAKERQSRQVASVNLSANTITTAADKKTSNREVRSVNVAANTITTKSSHGMPTGARIEITGGTAPAPLVKGTTYYAIKVDSDTLKVAATKAQADNGNAIAITNDGAGQIVVTKVTLKPIPHKLRTGDVIHFTGDVPPAPLELDVDYHAVRIDDNTFAVALSLADANRGLIVALTDRGEGDVSVTESTRRHRMVTKAGREERWGWVQEVFVEGDGEDKAAALDQAGEEALLDASAERSIELETEEVPGMRFGDPIGLGDTVAVDLPSGGMSSEVIGAAEITATPDDGVVVKLIPGDPDGLDPVKRLAADIRRVKRKVRKRRKD